MTVIAGLVDQGTVLLGGDSAGVSGYHLTVRADAKTFVNGPYVLGFTSSFRMGQILRWAFTPPPPPPAADLDRFMRTEWIDAVRQALKDGGYARVDAGEETGGCFLVGVSGRLFKIDADFQVGEAVDPYLAVGCGADLALGALYATANTGMSGEDRILIALRAAERHSAGVRGPFTLTRQATR